MKPTSSLYHVVSTVNSVATVSSVATVISIATIISVPGFSAAEKAALVTVT